MADIQGARSIIEWAENEPGSSGGEFTPSKERFITEGTVGRGAMGEVLLVSDQDLKRQIAMKVLREESAGTREHRMHFLAEAQATSQLEHPGIPPVHDIGLTPEGRLFFTMKLVQGRTLGEVIHDLVLKRRVVLREFDLHRLVTVLARICEPLHFAHERGVVHRDLKPENIMLGDFGEVHVMDWGIAKTMGESDEEGALEPVETMRTESGLETQHGTVKGTIPYMSPEQLQGEPIDRRSDIYALGCLLYEMMSLQMAFDPHDSELLRNKVNGTIADVRTRNPRRKVPEPLAKACERAMATDPSDRFQTANQMAAALRGWLDGTVEAARRHKDAERLAADGREAANRYRVLELELRAAATARDESAEQGEGWKPLAEQTSWLEGRARVEALERDTAIAFADATHRLNAALVQEEDNPSARTALADLWTHRLDDAEERGHRVDSAHALAMVERHDDGRLASYVEGGGTLTLSSAPSGAEVSLSRYVERGGILVADAEQSIGTTPIEGHALPMGSYLCVLRQRGLPDVRYPVHIDRNRRWAGKVRMRTAAELGQGFVHIPAGSFSYGEGKTREQIDVPGFAIQRFPVTFGEYLEFVTHIMAEEGIEAATACAPQTPGDGLYVGRDEHGAWRPLSTLVEGDAYDLSVERLGEGFLDRVPVMGVTFEDAQAYCAWKTATTGFAWRLPTEQEREKAARGVDGRRHPWGETQHASLAKCRESRRESTQPEPVGAFPTATSVYGMGDAAGGVWDWTTSWLENRGVLRVLRGGSWGTPAGGLQCAGRFGELPSNRNSTCGFRCARDL